jgi:Leucine-rich repeat (LRR) protein
MEELVVTDEPSMEWAPGNGISVSTDRTTLPPEIGELHHLEKLIVVDKQLQELPPFVGGLTALKTLEVSETAIDALPSTIGQLRNLQVLDASDTNLATLPPEIGRLTTLTHLNVHQCNLTTLPPEMAGMTSLTSLKLYGNPLGTVPSVIFQLQALTNLSLDDTGLTGAFPAGIGNLVRLVELSVAGNALTSLPSDMGRLRALEYLDASRNKLTSVPAEMVQLTNLSYLALGSNRIAALPPGLSDVVADIVGMEDNVAPLPSATVPSAFADVMTYNPLDMSEQLIPEFVADNEDEGAFVVERANRYTGNAVNWLLRAQADENDPVEFVECTDDAPADWQGNAYAQYKKKNGRVFVVLMSNGVNVMVEKPSWLWHGAPPAAVFRLVEGEAVTKFMTSHLLPTARPDFDVRGAEHCNQAAEVRTYRLEPVTSRSGGGKKTRRRQAKTKKRARKQTKKKKKKKTRQTKKRR